MTNIDTDKNSITVVLTELEVHKGARFLGKLRMKDIADDDAFMSVIKFYKAVKAQSIALAYMEDLRRKETE